MTYLNLVVIRSTDIDRAVTFYRMLGMRFTQHSHGNGPVHYTSETADLVFELYPLASNQMPMIAMRLGFQVDDLDGLVVELGEIGVNILSPPQDSPWGRRAVVKDFDGHIVELTEAKLS
jgi:catechol 2,3-dioxygenase-like lactoylglutathione lyase family enzyme